MAQHQLHPKKAKATGSRIQEFRMWDFRCDVLAGVAGGTKKNDAEIFLQPAGHNCCLCEAGSFGRKKILIGQKTPSQSLIPEDADEESESDSSSNVTSEKELDLSSQNESNVRLKEIYEYDDIDEALAAARALRDLASLSSTSTSTSTPSQPSAASSVSGTEEITLTSNPELEADAVSKIYVLFNLLVIHLS